MAKVNAQNIIEKDMLAAFLEVKLIDAIKLYPLTKVGNVDAEAGATIQVPQTQYIGDAADVAAGAAIELDKITQTMANCVVKKIAKGMTFTVEDINNAFIDIQAEAEKQMLKSLADKVEKDLFAELKKGTLKVTVDALDVDGLAEAIVPFGEDIEEQMYLFVNPADLAVLRKDDNFIVNANHGGGNIKSAGEIFGLQVVVTNRVEANAPIILKDEAVALYLKQGVKVEEEKDIIHQVHNVVATQHYAVMLHDDTKVIQITVG